MVEKNFLQLKALMKKKKKFGSGEQFVDFVFVLVIVGACCAVGAVGLVAAAVFWYK